MHVTDYSRTCVLWTPWDQQNVSSCRLSKCLNFPGFSCRLFIVESMQLEVACAIIDGRVALLSMVE